MNPDTWLARFREICSTSDWEALAGLRKSTNQRYVSGLDHAGLVSFYEEVLASGLDESKASQVRIEDIGPFRSGVAHAFQAAASRLATMPQVKAVYFEYFFDGGDSCTGNLFLCEQYSDADDYWGAEFGRDGMVKGPDVSPYFAFDRELEWELFPRYVAEEYVNGRLLAAVLDEWTKSGISGLPLGFANHDHEIVRAPVDPAAPARFRE